MRNTFLSSLLLPILACASLSIAAEPSTTNTSVPAPVSAVQKVSGDNLSQRLDLNRADALALQQGLSGIGQAKAEAIIAYRNANGPFASVDELLEIKGIGSTLLERNREKLTVD